MDTNDSRREAPRKRRPRPEETAGTRRPAQPPRKAAAQRPRQPQEGRRPSATRREPGEEAVRFTAPQGAGTRKSAPQRTPQQQKEAQRRAAQKRKNQPAPEPNQKRTLKDNPLQSFISGVKAKPEEKTDAEGRAKARQEKKAAAEARKKKQAQRHNTPAVVYTEPKVFNSSRLLMQMITVAAIVAALIMGMSVFFKVKTITVSGAETYSPWAVREASGISEGDGLLTFSRAKATAQITAKLPYVEKSRIGIKLPDTVMIYIEEADVAYAIQDDTGSWCLISSDGRIMDMVTQTEASQHTQILGVRIYKPELGQQAVAQEAAAPESTESTDPSAPTAPTEAPVMTATGALRLSTALQIVKALEANDIVGQAASVDVSHLEDIMLWYGTRYQVNLGDINRMDYKVACMNDVILQLSEYQSGILDISFTIWADKVGYTPFG